MDIGNAYLEASMGDEDVFIELDTFVVATAKRLGYDLDEYADGKGRVVARLDKALYGCVQSARRWYDRLRGVLERLGFVANSYDPCVFNTLRDGRQITVCCYVDDLLCTCVKRESIIWLHRELAKEFKKVKVCEGDEFEFVSLEVIQRDGNVSVSMDKYVRSLLGEWGGDGKDGAPAGQDLMKRDYSSPLLNSADKELFHHRVARLLYFAKRVGPDLLLAVNVLSSYVKSPNQEDMDRLDRVYRYLNANKERRIDFWRDAKVEVCSYIDASFACHDDYKSRTGCVLMCCGAYVGAWTSKQGLNTKSSAEAELVGLTDECGWAIWARNWIEAQGHEPGVVKIFQDNTSVAEILKRGPVAQLRTRHLSIRYHFVADLIKRKELKIEPCGTENMLADGLTKPLVGATFKKIRASLITVI
jgi:hypothetical protein